MIGRTLGHYLVQERLGSGGMGEVYVALDTSLGRKIALKVLPAELASDPARRERLRREAKALAALKHPNIVTIHSVEEAEGLLFLTLELVEGTSLRQRIDHGTIPPAEIVAIGTQIGEGLARAHDAGILHRDLKPQNVMLGEDGQVKLLDFGLAKPLASRDVDTEAATLTRDSGVGMLLGTPGYMAPEQALGNEMDVRADLFTLGVVLYEMATGRRPFRGGTLGAFFNSLLNESPPSPSELNADLPRGLAQVLDKALQKDPERRYATARELVSDLAGVDLRPGSPRRSSIAVLPFSDLSPEKDQEYFCHGLAEELIGSLGALPGVRVVARTSTFAVQAQGLEVREIGRRLQVDTVLEGSVRKAGARIRITTQLIDASDGYQLWSKRFDREMGDVFAVQDQIASTVAAELQGEIGTPAAEPRSTRATSNLEAYDAYLRGLHAMNRWTEPWVDRAVLSFEKAIRLDPDYAPAHAALAECLVWFYAGIGTRPARLTVPRAQEAARKAIERGPDLAESHKVTALLAMSHDWDRAAAERGFVRAIALNPGSADARVWNGWRLALLEGAYESALAELKVAEGLDPLDLKIKTQIGYVHYFLRDYLTAEIQFRRVLALDSNFAFAHYALGDVYAQQRKYAEAVWSLQESMRLGGSTVNHLAIVAHVHALSGRTPDAHALLADIREKAIQGQASPIWVALVHIGLREHDLAFEWLDRAFEEKDGSLILVAASPEFDPLRKDARFRALLERMGLGHRAGNA